MSVGALIYNSPWLYTVAMRMLYGRHFRARYTAIAELIPDNSHVAEVCAGDCRLYLDHLRQKNTRYLALDIAPRMLAWGQSYGVETQLWDGHADEIPAAEIVIMQASLYQFLPDADAMVEKMLAAATKRVIIAEPIRNLATTLPGPMRTLVKWATQPKDNDAYQSERFERQSLEALFERHRCDRVSEIPGGRELIGEFYVSP